MLVNYQGYKCGMWVKGSRRRVVQAEPVLVQRDFLRIFFSPSQVCLSRMCIILCFNVQTKEMGKKVKPCLQRRIQKYIFRHVKHNSYRKSKIGHFEIRNFHRLPICIPMVLTRNLLFIHFHVHV